MSSTQMLNRLVHIVLASGCIVSAPAVGVPAVNSAGIMQRYGRSVVLIRCKDSKGEDLQLGSGFVIDGSGLVVTCFHVLRGASSAEATFSDGATTAIKGVRAWDAPGDLAIVELADAPRNLKALPLRQDRKRQIGEPVLAIGHPQGFRFTPSLGIVSGVHTTAELPPPFSEWIGAPETNVWIQTSAAVDGGNSGGPLIDDKGRVLGVMTWVAGSGGKLAFASDACHLSGLRDKMGAQAVPLAELTGPEEELRDLAREFGAEHYWVPPSRAKTQGGTTRSPTEDYLPRVWEFAQKYRDKPAETTALQLFWAMVSDPQCTTNRGPVVKQAAARMLSTYSDSSEYVYPILVLQSSQLEEAREFLRSMGEKTSNQRVRAAAWLALAVGLDGDGQHPDKADEALRWAERLQRELPDVKLGGQTMGKTAAELAFKLKHLVIGRVPPEAAGKDDEERPVKLADYRGKVVLLTFWSDRFGECRELYEMQRYIQVVYTNRPFALLGVNADSPDILRRLRKDKKVTWSNCADGSKGPIASAWHVETFPSMFILDEKGVIRHCEFDPGALRKLVAETVKALDGGVVHPGGDGSLSLSANMAELHGPMIRVQVVDGRCIIANWVKAGDWASWQVDFPQPGRYKVSVQVAKVGKRAASLVVSNRNKEAVAEISGTGGWDKYESITAGVFNIQRSGVHTVNVRPLSPKDWHKVNLRSVNLEPVR